MVNRPLPVELLAPARDADTGIAAINAGADAVYIGAARFGAREAAGNPLEDIERLIAYAHRYWARVYVTVNTLLYDEELDEARSLIWKLYEIGADALIIQDIGLLELDLPPLALFASTQMHNHTPERVRFLEQAGFSRVILARELTLEQIRQIRAQTSIELEGFIHGALCVSYSGQCYLSYALGGRSGNRGQCAQPCRRLYSLYGADGQAVVQNRYLLSLKDLNLSDHLQDLLEAGITSFKIEGRLKDRAYVMNVVAAYRQRLDALLDGERFRKASSGSSRVDFSPDLRKTFNRGFTTYFLKGRDPQMASPFTPKSVGEPLGKVVKVWKEGCALEDGAPEVHAGDGICYLDGDNVLQGTVVLKVQGNRLWLEKMEGLQRGALMFRNHDRLFLQQLEKSRTERKIAVQFTLREDPQGMLLRAEDEDGNFAESVWHGEITPALNPDRMLETFQRQISSLGGTEFTCGGIRVLLATVPFLPVQAINALRREVVERLRAERLRNFPRIARRRAEDGVRFPAERLSFEGNVLNRLARQFYLRHGVREIESAAEAGLDMRGRKVMTTRFCLRYQLGACPKQNNPVRLPEPLYLEDELGNRLSLRFRCAECVMEIYYEGNARVKEVSDDILYRKGK